MKKAAGAKSQFVSFGGLSDWDAYHAWPVADCRRQSVFAALEKASVDADDLGLLLAAGAAQSSVKDNLIAGRPLVQGS